MKKFLLILIFSFTLLHLNAQTPNWVWAKSGFNDGSSTYSDLGNSTCTDINGNIYITGYFYSPTIIFGSITLTNSDPSGNTYDLFIVKYDPLGNVLWAKSAGGSGSDSGNGMSSDLNGNVYLTGHYSSLSIVLDTATITNPGGNHFFIAKFNSLGDILWVRNEGEFNENTRSYGISCDDMGNAIVIGNFTGVNATFGSVSFANSNPGSFDIFVVKYDSLGNALWVKGVNGADSDDGFGVSTDYSGNVFITGGYKSLSASFDGIILTATGYLNVFIAKYNSAGIIQWAKQAGGADNETGFSISNDFSGNAYITGYYYSGLMTFDSTHTITNSGDMNIFIVKYDSGGNVLWAKTAGGNLQDEGTGVITDINNNIYITGGYSSPYIVFNTDTIYNAGLGDVFVTKYDSLGNVIWVENTGNIGALGGRAIACNQSEEVYVLSTFAYSSTLTLGSSTVTNANTSTSDVVIAKLHNSYTGIEEKSIKAELNICPNPFSSITTIQYSKEVKNGVLQIYNIIGERMKDIPFNDKNIILEKGELKSGVYFCKLIDERSTILVTKKIIIQ